MSVVLAIHQHEGTHAANFRPTAAQLISQLQNGARPPFQEQLWVVCASDALRRELVIPSWGGEVATLLERVRSVALSRVVNRGTMQHPCGPGGPANFPSLAHLLEHMATRGFTVSSTMHTEPNPATVACGRFYSASTVVVLTKSAPAIVTVPCAGAAARAEPNLARASTQTLPCDDVGAGPSAAAAQPQGQLCAEKPAEVATSDFVVGVTEDEQVEIALALSMAEVKLGGPVTAPPSAPPAAPPAVAPVAAMSDVTPASVEQSLLAYADQREAEHAAEMEFESARLQSLHAAQLAQAQQDHAAEVARVREEHAGEMARVRREHAAEVARMQDEHARELARMRAFATAFGQTRAPDEPRLPSATAQEVFFSSRNRYAVVPEIAKTAPPPMWYPIPPLPGDEAPPADDACEGSSSGAASAGPSAPTSPPSASRGFRLGLCDDDAQGGRTDPLGADGTDGHRQPAPRVSGITQQQRNDAAAERFNAAMALAARAFSLGRAEADGDSWTEGERVTRLQFPPLPASGTTWSGAAEADDTGGADGEGELDVEQGGGRRGAPSAEADEGAVVAQLVAAQAPANPVFDCVPAVEDEDDDDDDDEGALEAEPWSPAADVPVTIAGAGSEGGSAHDGDDEQHEVADSDAMEVPIMDYSAAAEEEGEPSAPAPPTSVRPAARSTSDAEGSDSEGWLEVEGDMLDGADEEAASMAGQSHK